MRRFLPVDHAEFHEQKELMPLDDEKLLEGITPLKATRTDRIIQVLQFIFGFGWLRLLVLLPALVLYIVLMIPIITTCNNRKLCDVFVPYGVFISQCAIRVLAFLLGIYYVEVKGDISKEVRSYAFNHQTVLDGPLLFTLKGFTIISMSEMLKVPVFGRILTGADSVFVDRTKSCGTSKYIQEAQLATHKRPVALSPEGKTSRGLYLLKFHTGGFITDEAFQCVAIRYTTYFTYGKSGYEWMCGGFKEWIWRTLSTPCAKVTLTFLPPHTKEEIKDLTPQQRALMANLEIANYLGIPAVTRTNVEAVNLWNEKLQKEKKLKSE